MQDLIKFEDRHRLYESVEKYLNLKKIDEVYYHDQFGDYIITFSAKKFLIRYISDRSQLIVSVASNSAPSRWYALSFIKNFINKADQIGEVSGFDLKSVLQLNDFLKNNFSTIAELLNEYNYKNTLNQISVLLKQEFMSKHPGVVKD